MTSIAPSERANIAALMEKIGPDAPTLCEGWTTRDLAAHLVLRMSRPVAAFGIAIPALAAHTARTQRRVAQQEWPQLLAKVRRRAWWLAPLDEAINGVEYFVHHEDVRRAQPDWTPRELPVEYLDAQWSRIRAQARLVLRKVPATVTVTWPGHDSSRAGRGGPAAVDLVGEPPELLMFLTGRQAHALVELAGPTEITDRMRVGRYGV